MDMDIESVLAEAESALRGNDTVPADKAAAEDGTAKEPAAEPWRDELHGMRATVEQQGRTIEALNTVLYSLNRQRDEADSRPAPARREAPEQVSFEQLQAAWEKDPLNTLLWMQRQADEAAEARLEARLQEMRDPKNLRSSLDPLFKEYLGPLVQTHFDVGRRNALEEWAERNPDHAWARGAIDKTLKDYPELAQRKDALDVAFRLARGSGLLEAPPAHGRFVGRSGGPRQSAALSEEERGVARSFGISEADFLKAKIQRHEEGN